MIFFYDFTSGVSTNSRISQETKHIYILQNPLKKIGNASRRTSLQHPTEYPVVNHKYAQDRSDDGPSEEVMITSSRSPRPAIREYQQIDRGSPKDFPESSRGLENFKLRRRVLKSIADSDDDEIQSRQLNFNNHAMIYRVRQR